MVCVVVTCRAAKLSSQGASLEHCQLLLQTVCEYAHLLTKACGRSRLAVSLGEHGDSVPLVSISVELTDELLNERVVYIVQCLLH